MLTGLSIARDNFFSHRAIDIALPVGNNTGMTTYHPDEKLIAELGGTYAVARIFDIRPPSVTRWKERGIPPARRMYLELAYPELFGRPRKLLKRVQK